MKKIMFLGLLLVGMVSMSAQEACAQCTPGGTYYTKSTKYPIWYGKLDSVVNTGTDTFKMPLACKATSITFSTDFLKTSGTPTVTVAMYASANGGTSYGTTAVATYTVVPGSLTAPLTNTYMVNNPSGGNPFTNYMWVATGSSSSGFSWLGSVLIR